MNAEEKIKISKQFCYHCGDKCESIVYKLETKSFCCEGCKTVYQLFSENGLSDYYSLNSHPGTASNSVLKSQFDFLDNENVKSKIIQFSNGHESTVTFYIPKIHCSSCIWLLENLYKISPAISQSRVNFLRKEVKIVFSEIDFSLQITTAVKGWKLKKILQWH